MIIPLPWSRPLSTPSATAPRCGWKTPEPAEDNELTQRWRRRLMEQDFDETRTA